MEPIVSKSLPVSLNQHRSHGPIFVATYRSCIVCNHLILLLLQAVISPAITPMSPSNPFAEPESTNPFESDGGEDGEQQETKEQVRLYQQYLLHLRGNIGNKTV